MTKRILLSLGSIAFMGALAAGATGAFFTDSETSTGNVFTAGSMVLQIDSMSHYDGLVCDNAGTDAAPNYQWVQGTSTIDQQPTSRADLLGKSCDGSWAQGAFGPNSKFFNISDIKPGDGGEDTISLHPTNDAWVCANIKTTSNNENTLTAPEAAAGDVTNDPNGGELAQNTFVVGWLDTGVTVNGVTTGAGDNIWEPGETQLFGGTTGTPLSAIVGSGINVPLADSAHLPAMSAGSTSFVGLEWCTGTMTVVSPGVVTCDGSTLGNIIQTDSATADVTLTATQSRNNPSFLCAPTPIPPGGLTVIKHVVDATTSISVITASQFSIHVASSTGEVAGSPQTGSEAGTTYSSLNPATYTVSETGGPATPASQTLTTTFSGDCSGVPTVAVTSGTTKTCTITNTYTDNVTPTS